MIFNTLLLPSDSRDRRYAEDSSIANSIARDDSWIRLQTQNADLTNITITIAHPYISHAVSIES